MADGVPARDRGTGWPARWGATSVVSGSFPGFRGRFPDLERCSGRGVTRPRPRDGIAVTIIMWPCVVLDIPESLSRPRHAKVRRTGVPSHPMTHVVFSLQERFSVTTSGREGGGRYGVGP